MLDIRTIVQIITDAMKDDEKAAERMYKEIIEGNENILRV